MNRFLLLLIPIFALSCTFLLQGQNAQAEIIVDEPLFVEEDEVLEWENETILVRDTITVNGTLVMVDGLLIVEAPAITSGLNNFHINPGGQALLVNNSFIGLANTYSSWTRIMLEEQAQFHIHSLKPLDNAHFRVRGASAESSQLIIQEFGEIEDMSLDTDTVNVSVVGVDFQGGDIELDRSIVTIGDSSFDGSYFISFGSVISIFESEFIACRTVDRYYDLGGGLYFRDTWVQISETQFRDHERNTIKLRDSELRLVTVDFTNNSYFEVYGDNSTMFQAGVSYDNSTKTQTMRYYLEREFPFTFELASNRQWKLETTSVTVNIENGTGHSNYEKLDPLAHWTDKSVGWLSLPTQYNWDLAPGPFPYDLTFDVIIEPYGVHAQGKVNLSELPKDVVVVELEIDLQLTISGVYHSTAKGDDREMTVTISNNGNSKIDALRFFLLIGQEWAGNKTRSLSGGQTSQVDFRFYMVPKGRYQYELTLGPELDELGLAPQVLTGQINIKHALDWEWEDEGSSDYENFGAAICALIVFLILVIAGLMPKTIGKIPDKEDIEEKKGYSKDFYGAGPAKEDRTPDRFEQMEEEREKEQSEILEGQGSRDANSETLDAYPEPPDISLNTDYYDNEIQASFVISDSEHDLNKLESDNHNE